MSENHEYVPGPFRSKEQLDVVLGFLGFWIVAIFISTLWRELTGQPALGWAIALLISVLAGWGLLRLRRRLPSVPRRRG